MAALDGNVRYELCRQFNRVSNRTFITLRSQFQQHTNSYGRLCILPPPTFTFGVPHSRWRKDPLHANPKSFSGPVLVEKKTEIQPPRPVRSLFRTIFRGLIS